MLEEQLQTGPRAEIYRARRVADGRPVVLKVLDANHSGGRDIERLRHEYDLRQTLKGLAVVQPRALSTFEGRPALELADFRGSSLDRLVGKPMPIDGFLRLAAEIASVVADIHGRGLIHKDLKPHNILLGDETGEVRITDFCIASRMPGEQTAARPTRLIEGSLPYVSPEQTGRMNRSIDSRSDLYTLGVTFYQILTGRLPFEARDAVGWVHCHVARRPLPPVGLRPSIPEVVSNVILKLLAKVPDERYQSALGLAYDLERCLQQWRETGTIAPFPLGERDVSDRFLVPQRLYGRAAESAELRAMFERVATTEQPELVMVSGSSGIGKTALVQELHRPIVSRRGAFVAGKFEQYQGDVPYFTFVQAFREVMLDILAESADSIAAWRQRIQAATGQNAQLVVDLIPEVGLVIGPQPPVSSLSSSEAENRQRRVLREFLATFATKDHPLVIFLDDLQWADPASLKLLVDLVIHPSTHHLLVVGAYRDNEVGPGHRLLRALDRIRAEGAAIRTLVLGPLPEAHVSELVADTVRCSRQEAQALADLVYEKTGGNPFFAIQFLTALHRRGLIFFDRGERRWRWDLSQIRAQGYTDNVIDLMVGKLRNLPVETQGMLQLAACLGVTVDTETLAAVSEENPEPALRAAFDEGLILGLEQAYQFPHDRVQEAAYALIPEGERAAVHLRIGRLLLARTAPERVDTDIFKIVNQLDRAAALIESREERERVAELNLVAGKRAKRSAAYASALTYAAAGAAFLFAESWSSQYDLTFSLELLRAECEYLTGALEAAEARLSVLWGRAARLADRAAVTCLRVDLYTTLDRSDRGVEACLDYLRHVGIRWPPHPAGEEVHQEYQQIWRQLGDRPIEDLVNLPAMSDPDWRVTMDVLTSLIPVALLTDGSLLSLSIGRMANLSLEHGYCDASSIAFGRLGMILGPYFGDYRAAFRFGKLSLELAEKRGPARFKARAYVDFATFVNPWVKHIRTSRELLERASEIASNIGDVTFTAYSYNILITNLLAAGDPLADVQREAEDGLAFARKMGFGLVIDIITSQLRLVRTLQGLTPGISSAEGEGFEAQFEQHLEQDPRLAIAACWHWIRKLQSSVFAEDYPSAVRSASKAAELLWTSRPFFELAEYHFYGALARAGHHDAAPAEEKAQDRELLASHVTQLELWAANCPENFEDRHALASAELARIEGRDLEAQRLYEQAIRAARENGFVHNEALANERASRFSMSRGRGPQADAHLREAHAGYLRWGAQGKARDLERLHPELVEPTAPGPSLTASLQSVQLDLLSVVKALQTISGVIVREDLLRTLLRLVLEAGGARRAVVLVAREDRLDVGGEVAVEEPAPAQPAGPGPSLPDSLLKYVQRTGDRVLLDDAASDSGRFAADPYWTRARPRSVLCLPVRRQAQLVAVLYLENDLVPGAFPPDRLLALELLAAQAAISLENALLLERERAGRAEAEAAERRARLLDEATAIMTSTYDYDRVFSALTRLCVRAFADWAIIDLVEADRVVRLAGAHRDPAKEPLLRELAERYPATRGSPAPAANVINRGAPRLLSELSDDDVRAQAIDERHAEIIRGLGTRSAIAVPLVARETRLGALTLASASPGRFGPADLELASEIARRAALAIDNARLLRETQAAVRLRDDFLSVASHELRTPIASLILTIERLRRASAAGRQLSPEAVDASLERVDHSAQRLKRLTDDLLDVTRIEQDRLHLQTTAVDLGSLAREVVDDLKPELAAAGCPARVDADHSVDGVWDRSRLQEVITNLITNALKFGPGLPIEVAVRNAGAMAELSVRDYGVGIALDRQPFIFDRFERAVPANHYGGLGLGLYIARRIVQSHGGDLTVESEPGHGAIFTVTLPRQVTG